LRQQFMPHGLQGRHPTSSNLQRHGRVPRQAPDHMHTTMHVHQADRNLQAGHLTLHSSHSLLKWLLVYAATFFSMWVHTIGKSCSSNMSCSVALSLVTATAEQHTPIRCFSDTPKPAA
jgi:hypothetical protein